MRSVVMALVGALGLCGVLVTSAAAEQERPNIIFIFSDDHAAQAIGAYQGALDYGLKLDHTPTPNLDRMARQGMRFDNTFVTNSICKPSRAVILSGMHSHLNGVPSNGQSIDTALEVFPDLLQEAGYQTALIGKWHLGSEPQGYDYYEVLYGQGPYYNPTMRTPEGDVERHGHTTEIIADRTLEWLKTQRDRDEPFMLMMQHKAPHRNWLPGPDHAFDYVGRELPEPETLDYDYEGLASPAHEQDMEIHGTMSWGWDLKVPEAPDTGEATGLDGLIERNDLTDEQLAVLEAAYRPWNEKLYDEYGDMSEAELRRWKYQRYIRDYLRTIRGIDDTVGRLMSYLKRANLDENTIVIYNGDQGFFLGENGWFDKRWIYEESFRTPLIVRWPGEVPSGSVNEDLVQNLDLTPTFLELAGVDVPERMQGRSLVPILKGDNPGDWRDAIYYHYYEGLNGPHDVARHYGIRTERYTLAHYYQTDEWELFDLKEDPEQLESVYDDPDYADVRERLKAKLRELQDYYRDETPEESISDIVMRQHLGQIEDLEPELAIELATGSDQPAEEVDPSAKPMTVGAWAKPTAADGAIISRGGQSLGYMLYLKDGRPAFAIRSAGELKEVVADEPVAMDEPVHLAGTLDANGKLRLYVNGELAAEDEGHFIMQNPNDGLSVGADGGSRVGRQSGEIPFQGELREIRVYWGVLEQSAIAEWASEAAEF